ncbi:DUF2306 domain-containing protein [Alteromonas facilis]|uniref:DUF2306 domain-containing protein n=1 Tax=Alteromonas facilis TaxID=2048004 RepID=UPI001F0CB7CC|nr:DUF2306 domain-containing protein [Alteromonas facilis]
MNTRTTTDSTFPIVDWMSAPKVTAQLMKVWVGFIWLGQWMFAAYIFYQFAQPAVLGTIGAEHFSHMIKGHVENDTIGNGILLGHVLPVLLLSATGIMQLIPAIRSRFPTFHRWNGRVFLTLGLLGALSGLYLTWGRGGRLSDIGALGVTLNGLLIPVAIALAWHFALKRDFRAHRRWAVHAFILVNGVWAMRLLLMGWFMLNQGPNGNNSTMDGPMDMTLSFASYLLPMAIAELYFAIERTKKQVLRLFANTALLITVLITILGVSAASMMMWLPRITAAM